MLIVAIALAGCASTASKNETVSSDARSPAAAPPAASAAATGPATAANATACAEEASKGKAKKGQKAAPAGKACTDSPPASSTQPVARAAAGSDGSYDLTGNKPVTDSKTVEQGQGKKVKGINDWEGEITGVPAAGSAFRKLKIGMPLQQVTGLIGQPSDQGAYITGKAFIPFYYGSDKSRWEAVYRNQGRLIFSSQAGFGAGNWHLTWIIHNASEGTYR